MEIEGFFPPFNSSEFLNKFLKGKMSDIEFDIFLKQLSYSRFYKEKKVSNQFVTNQYIVALIESFRK